jgi:hypothetical protein
MGVPAMKTAKNARFDSVEKLFTDLKKTAVTKCEVLLRAANDAPLGPEWLNPRLKG